MVYLTSCSSGVLYSADISGQCIGPIFNGPDFKTQSVRNISNKPNYAVQQPARPNISIVLDVYVCNVHKPTSIHTCQVNYVRPTPFLYSATRHEEQTTNDNARQMKGCY